MQKGHINVHTENIFPIIKKFLYSDHEIFLRELVSNAVDASQKLKALSSMGEFKGELGDLTIEVKLDATAGTISVCDKGVGMSAEEVEKYITQIAFSGAEEFVKKYDNIPDGNQLIGHFGLGFYSAFMVSSKVDIVTKTHKDAPAVKWSCDGSPEYTIEETTKEGRGTDIILHIAEDSKEFLEESRLKGILDKYCKFLPVEIVFGTKQDYVKDENGEYTRDADNKMISVDVPNVINNPKPLWKIAPSELKDEDYKSFYRELYPMVYEDALFNIHLNVDYPFNLTGVLYFPKLKNNMEVQKNKIQLYCNQVFVTDSVENIVPDFLTLMHGVIDSPDIPLNVSRSYLQSDANVKKISSHITKKVADKLEDIFKNDRADFEKKWDDIKVFIHYGFITDEKFYERANKFVLLKNIEGSYFTIEEYKEKIKVLQENKDKKLVVLYTTNKDEQYTYIQSAKDKGYDVLECDGALDQHFINHLETKLENISFTRVDSNTVDKLIEKEESFPSKLSDAQKEMLKPVFSAQVQSNYYLQFENLSESDDPILITQPEFMRRMKDMQKIGGGGAGFYGNMPDMYNLVVNANHPLVSKLLTQTEEKFGSQVTEWDIKIKKTNTHLTELRKDDKAKEENKEAIEKAEKELEEVKTTKEKALKEFGKDNTIVKQLTDLALLSQNMLKGEDLARFIRRSFELIGK